MPCPPLCDLFREMCIFTPKINLHQKFWFWKQSLFVSCLKTIWVALLRFVLCIRFVPLFHWFSFTLIFLRRSSGWAGLFSHSHHFLVETRTSTGNRLLVGSDEHYARWQQCWRRPVNSSRAESHSRNLLDSRREGVNVWNTACEWVSERSKPSECYERDSGQR